MPHNPLVVMIIPLVGSGTTVEVETVDVETVVRVEVGVGVGVEIAVDVDITTGVDTELVVGVGVGVGAGALDEGPLPPLGFGQPHAPKFGWHPIFTRQKSIESPQKPYSEQQRFPEHFLLPPSGPHTGASACRAPRRGTEELRLRELASMTAFMSLWRAWKAHEPTEERSSRMAATTPV